MTNKKTSSFFYVRICSAVLLLLGVVGHLPIALAQTEVINTETVNPEAVSSSNNVMELTADETTIDNVVSNELNTLAVESENSSQTPSVLGDTEVEAEAQLNELELNNESKLKATATLPHNLSPWGMFMAADVVVKVVMIGLALASLLTWTVLLSKTFELTSLRGLLRRNLEKIIDAHTLADAANADNILGVGRELIDAAEAELHLSADILKKNESEKDTTKEGIKERVVSRLSRIEAAATRRMMVGTGLLATIGAVAPFVGLFGTVWGIMNSFIGISQANTTNLAVVAPGIAEALLATALGLVAAIPAVVIYNHFTRKIAGAKALLADSSAGIMRLVSRDLDRGVNLVVVKNSPAPPQPTRPSSGKPSSSKPSQVAAKSSPSSAKVAE